MQSQDLQKYFENVSQYDLRQLALKSTGWFRQKIADLRKKPVFAKKLIYGDHDDKVKRLQIGKVYLFHYDPKWKEKLPVWDEFPLVLPFSPTPTGFIGINLHYLSYAHRAWLLNQLTKENPNKTDRVNMRVSWDILSGFSKVDVAQYATHQYIVNHIVSPIRLVHVEDYAKMIMLPVQKFRGDKAKEFKRMF